MMISQKMLGLLSVPFGFFQACLLATSIIIGCCKYGRLEAIAWMTCGRFTEESYRESAYDLKLSRWIIYLLLGSFSSSVAGFIIGIPYRSHGWGNVSAFFSLASFLGLVIYLNISSREKDRFRVFLENTPWIVKVNLGLQECPFKKAAERLAKQAPA